MKKLLIVFAILTTLGGFLFSHTASATETVTICHAAGQDDTTQYVTLTLPETAVYGQAGHFNEDGTPQAGHENDYMGACETQETTTSSTTSTTSSIPSTMTSTTTAGPTTTSNAPTTTVEETTSTSSPTTSSEPETSTSSVPPENGPTTTGSYSTDTTTTILSLPVLVTDLIEECLQRDGTNLPEGSFIRLSDGQWMLATGTTRRIVTFCAPIVAVDIPPVPQAPAPTAAPAPVVAQLPTTGTNANIAWIALATVLSGAFLTLATRRRTV